MHARDAQEKPFDADQCTAANDRYPRRPGGTHAVERGERGGGVVSERRIIELNIKHYRDLLARESDPAKRDAFARLLPVEQDKLAALPSEMNRPRSRMS